MRRPVLLVLSLLVVLEVVFVFFPDPILLIWPDSIGYLGPAADALESGRMPNWNTTSGGFMYPLMLWGMLRVAPEPWIILLVQRLIVIATCVSLAAAFWWLWRAIDDGRRPFVGVVLAAFWLLTFILYPPVIGLGQSLMPEVIFSFVLTIVLVGLVAIALPSAPPASRTAASWLVPFSSVALAFIKPHWLLGAVLVAAMTPWLGSRQQRRQLIVRTLISVTAAFALVVVPQAVWEEAENARFARVFGPRSLFCNSADLMHAYFAPRTADPLALEIDRQLEQLFTPAALAEARTVGWELLHFDGNECTHGAVRKVIQDRFQGRLGAEVAYYLTTYLRAVVAEPMYLPKRLGRQLGALAYKPFNSVQATVFLTSRYFRVLESARDQRPLFTRWHNQYGHVFSSVIHLPTRHWQLPLRVFFTAAGLLLSAACILAVIHLGITHRRRRERSGIEKAFLGVLASALALNILIATVHTFDVERYSAMQVPLFSLLGYVASLTLYTAVMLRRASVSPPTTDA